MLIINLVYQLKFSNLGSFLRTFFPNMIRLYHLQNMASILHASPMKTKKKVYIGVLLLFFFLNFFFTPLYLFLHLTKIDIIFTSIERMDQPRSIGRGARKGAVSSVFCSAKYPPLQRDVVYKRLFFFSLKEEALASQ